MEVREMLDYYDAPDIALANITVHTLPQKRLLALLMTDGVNTIGDLKKMSDDDIKSLSLFGNKKLEKLREFITDWYEDDFSSATQLNITKPDTVIQSLQEEVFGTYKNMSIVAMRGNYQTYESIGEKYGQSRQSVQDKEKAIYKKFVEWYERNRLSEKIGNWDELKFYCDTQFPEDQREIKSAMRRFVTLAKLGK